MQEIKNFDQYVSNIFQKYDTFVAIKSDNVTKLVIWHCKYMHILDLKACAIYNICY